MPPTLTIEKAPTEIVQRLHAAGHEAYVVGGAVRDLLLGVQPKDFDIATSASPEEVRAVFGRGRCRIIGRRFRLAHVFMNRNIYEVSTFRRCPSREERRGRKSDDGLMIWNDNQYGSLEEDASRRDFTVNSLYYDICGGRGIIDFWGGQKDLKNKLVRAIGDPVERFAEDPVRMLRALKLRGQFGFKLEESLARALQQQRDNLSLASRSRLFEELLKVLSTCRAEAILDCLQEYGLLLQFWPVLAQSWEEEEGQLARFLLKEQGRELQEGKIHLSKAMSLSCASLPYLMAALGGDDMKLDWKRNDASRQLAQKTLRNLFEGYSLPNYFQERVISICFLLPRLLVKRPAPKTLRHYEYKYARKLLEYLCAYYNWDTALLQKLPEAVFRNQDDEKQAQQKQRRPQRRKKLPENKHTRKQ
ncbi:MAG: polynucleotide adenylyltransferase PcnB [Oligosphaeraceae bacterium]|nr:polynucleotide adenylyltransferase PcnB [Oligosphaeraceae bacterium]